MKDCLVKLLGMRGREGKPKRCPIGLELPGSEGANESLRGGADFPLATESFEVS